MTTEAITAASLITEAGTAITAGISMVWDVMTGNPLLVVFVGASLVSLGFRFFRKAKRTAG